MVALGLFVVAVPIIMLMGGVGSFVGRRKHLLSTLLSLEYIMLSEFWLMVLSISFLGGDSYFILFFFYSRSLRGCVSVGFTGVSSSDTWYW